MGRRVLVHRRPALVRHRPADRVRPYELSDELRGVLAFSGRSFPTDETRDAALHEELQISPVRYAHQLNWLAQQGHATPPDA